MQAGIQSITTAAVFNGLVRVLRLAVLMGVIALPGIAGSGAIDEYQLKAAYLYNVAKFVTWPQGAFHGPAEPIMACIAGETPIAAALEIASKDNMVQGRKLVVRASISVRQAAGCHILFVPAGERRSWHFSSAGILGHGMLIVGEADGFTSEGGVLNFKLEGERIRIQINIDAAEREHLQISSKLLSLSQIVKK